MTGAAAADEPPPPRERAGAGGAAGDAAAGPSWAALGRAGGAACGEHTHECGGSAWAFALPTEAAVAARIAVRMARERASSSGRDDGDIPSPEGSRDFRAVERLAHHWHQVPTTDRAQWLVLSVTLAECLRDAPAAAALRAGGTAAAAAQIAIAFSWLRANSFAITDDFAESSWSGAQFEQARRCFFSFRFSARFCECELCHIVITHTIRPPLYRPQIRVAQALYPTASLVNHACAPSAHASFRGRAICVRATRDIPEGGRVLIAYGPQAGQQTAAMRRKLLLTSHVFACRCAACEHGAGADAELEGLRCQGTHGCDGAVPFDGAAPSSLSPSPLS